MSSPAVIVTERERITARWAIVVIAVALTVAYHNSFSGPFVFDDIDSITNNASIRKLSTAWWPAPAAGGDTVAGRPLLNLSLALNYAISGENVWSYHALNLLIHFASAGLLFGIVRATLQRSDLRDKFGAEAVPVATVVALLWALHPLQTESVTYVIQRAESLMALFYLLTLYAFVRSLESSHRSFWQVVAVTSCCAGMATKEVMASAPLMVLLYERTFVSGTFREALRKRGLFYAGLVATWLVLFGFAISTGWRGGTVGSTADIPWSKYALTQIWAVTHYLRLTIWPDPLVFDYGTWLVQGAGDVWLRALVLLGLAGATVWGFWRRSPGAFLAVMFFAVLAPSSSIVPVATQTVAEHRMYLPLAAVVVLLVIASFRLAGRAGLIFCAAAALVCGALTIRRNEVYQNHVALWRDTAAKRPENAFARYNLAQALQTERRYAEAIPEYEAAIRLIPDYIEAHTNLGITFQHLERWEEAEKEYQLALRYDNRPIEALANLGSLLLARKRWEEAGRVYVKLLEFEPEHVNAHINLAQVLFAVNRTEQAFDELNEALQLDAGSADTYANVGNILKQWGHLDAARQQFEAAERLRARGR